MLGRSGFADREVEQPKLREASRRQSEKRNGATNATIRHGRGRILAFHSSGRDQAKPYYVTNDLAPNMSRPQLIARAIRMGSRTYTHPGMKCAQKLSSGLPRASCTTSLHSASS